MAMRRRIKVAANLMVSGKRKTKAAQDEKKDGSEPQTIAKSQPKDTCESNNDNIDKPLQSNDEVSNTSVERDQKDKAEDDTILLTSAVKVEEKTSRNINLDNQKSEESKSVEKHHGSSVSIMESQEKGEILDEKSEKDAHFKFPKRIEYNHSASCTPSVLSTEDDDEGANIMQMDLQKSSTISCPMSPTKQQSRQRIKPMPIFTQRRNSVINQSINLSGEDSGNDSETSMPTAVRRERHYSGSSSSGNMSSPNINYQLTHKFNSSNIPGGVSGRVRTESNCSVFSDSYSVAPSPSKVRKADEHNQFRNQSKRDFEARFSNGVPEKSSIKMFDLIYYNPVTNPMEQKPQIKRENSVKSDQSIKQEEDSKDSASAFPVPQLKLTADGEMIIDEKSLEIETTAEQEARKILAKSSLIYMDENTGMNGFYKRHNRTKEWPPAETIRFYRCLQTAGTDFSMMATLFKNRTRRDLKLKFKREERNNPGLVKKALLYPRQFNVEELKKQFDTEEKERELEERKWKELQAEAQKTIKKIHINTSRAARVLTYGEEVYKQIEGEAPKRKYRKRQNQSQEQQNVDENTEYPNTSSNMTKKPKQSVKTKSAKAEKIHKKASETSNATAIKTEPFVNVEDSVPQQERDTKSTIKLPSLLPDLVNLHNEQVMSSQQIETSNCDTEDMDIDTECTNMTLETEIMGLLDREEFESIHSSPTKGHEETRVEEIEEPQEPSSRILMNLDSGSVMVISDEINEKVETDLKTDESILPHDAVIADVDLKPPKRKAEYNADDIEEILTDIADGNLVMVSTLDPQFPDQVINEIYMIDKDTNDLHKEPLEIPKEIVDAILEVMV